MMEGRVEVRLSAFPLRYLCSQLLVHASEDGRSLLNAKLQQLFGFSQRLLLLSRFGRVPRQFGESKQGPRGVTQTSNDHAGAKARSVFADSPAFVFALSLLGGPCQNMFVLFSQLVLS